jgi:hypothetical protein
MASLAIPILCLATTGSYSLSLTNFRSKSHYDRRWVGHSVLASSPFLGPRPDFCYCQTVADLSTGSPSPTRGRVCHLSRSQSAVHVISTYNFTYRKSTESFVKSPVAYEMQQPFCFMSFNTIFVKVIILSSSDSDPLGSAMICWNMVATSFNESLRDELFALGAWTDWLGTSCQLCLNGKGAGLCNRGRLRLLLCVAAQRRRDGQTWAGVAGREPPSRCRLGRSLRPSLSHLFLGVPAASTVGAMRFLSVH